MLADTADIALQLQTLDMVFALSNQLSNFAVWCLCYQ